MALINKYYILPQEIIIPTYILTLFLNSLSASSADTLSLRHSLTTLCFKASVIMLTVGCRSSISAISLFWCIAKGTVITLLKAAVEPIITAHLQRNKARTFLIYSTCNCGKWSLKYNLKIFCTGKSRFIIYSVASKSANTRYTIPYSETSVLIRTTQSTAHFQYHTIKILPCIWNVCQTFFCYLCFIFIINKRNIGMYSIPKFRNNWSPALTM